MGWLGVVAAADRLPLLLRLGIFCFTCLSLFVGLMAFDELLMAVCTLFCCVALLAYVLGLLYCWGNLLFCAIVCVNTFVFVGLFH